MTAATASSPRDELAQRVRELLASREVREVRMFGGIAFMVDDRMAVSAGRDGSLLVRANPVHYDDLLLRGAAPAVMGDDRPMGTGWLSVPSSRIHDRAELEFWVTVGIDSRDAG